MLFVIILQYCIKILRKRVKNMEKGDFDQCLECKAPKHWLTDWNMQQLELSVPISMVHPASISVSFWTINFFIQASLHFRFLF